MAPQEIDRVAMPAHDDFFREYVYRRRPVVATGVFAGQPLGGIRTIDERCRPGAACSSRSRRVRPHRARRCADRPDVHVVRRLRRSHPDESVDAPVLHGVRDAGTTSSRPSRCHRPAGSTPRPWRRSSPSRASTATTIWRPTPSSPTLATWRTSISTATRARCCSTRSTDATASSCSRRPRPGACVRSTAPQAGHRLPVSISSA